MTFEENKNTMKEQVLEVAKWQSYIIFLLIYSFIFPLPSLGKSIVLSFILSGVNAYFIFNLSKALNWKFPIIWSVVSFIPIINMFLLLILDLVAIKLLRAAKLNVGFFGCNKEELERFAKTELYGKR